MVNECSALPALQPPPALRRPVDDNGPKTITLETKVGWLFSGEKVTFDDVDLIRI